jgi:crotonobetainyl-CoA:carnitine CoA-transferase CaiB-like acyl-CoA transferase
MPGRPMDGIRVVEVAQYTYVPAAGAVLADWGADVIKVEHAVTGDGQHGFAYLGQVAAGVRLTNFLPDARARLKIDVADIRAVNPDVIYMRGTALGARSRGGQADPRPAHQRRGHLRPR